ncbi:MAG: 3-oxoacyl-ACP synthase [Sphingomonadales bacterium]|nr:3-oxoacyl-ACP synthase [Sphingomonadales bacterium]MBU3991673.1 3-oxoacyl-ACP synthase [Alphaproteobacteria bacterium]
MTRASSQSPPWTSRARLAVLGTGTALPGPPLSSEDLIELVHRRFAVDVRHEARAVARRMAIASRHICRDFAARHEAARPGQGNADLAAGAVAVALAAAGLNVSDVGYLIGHTTTPEQPLPSNIAYVADRLGYAGPHVELRQACTGFANALMIATGLLAAPGAKPVVIVGSETGSLFFDPGRMAQDRGQIVNMMQMGDGAGAVVLGPAPQAGAMLEAIWFGSIGLGRRPGIQQLSGRQEFDHDFAGILKSGRELFDADVAAASALGFPVEAAHFLIPHQVSGRVRLQAASHLGVSQERVFVNADRIGNTGSAAIWLALADLRASGLETGARVLALGAEASKYLYGGFAYVHG